MPPGSAKCIDQRSMPTGYGQSLWRRSRRVGADRWSARRIAAPVAPGSARLLFARCLDGGEPASGRHYRLPSVHGPAGHATGFREMHRPTVDAYLVRAIAVAPISPGRCRPLVGTADRSTRSAGLCPAALREMHGWWAAGQRPALPVAERAWTDGPCHRVPLNASTNGRCLPVICCGRAPAAGRCGCRTSSCPNADAGRWRGRWPRPRQSPGPARRDRRPSRRCATGAGSSS